MNERPAIHHFILAIFLMACAMVRAAEPMRLAVISADKSAWSNFLMARLSKSPEVALVERDDLGKALDEIEIKELLGDRKKRSRFGEIAGADFLVILNIIDKQARLVVCDANLSITLQDQSIGIAEQPQEKALEVMADVALQTIRSFSGGVKQVVAVPDFVCRDLTFDFNYLQSDYAKVLHSAYRLIPGTAIVAIEEAKAIAAERDIAGIGQKERIVSVFIEGEYRTTRDLKSGSVSVEITLRARDASKVLIERKLPSVPTSQAGRELMAVFTKDLAAWTQSGDTKIDESSQYRMLIDRADEFSMIGDFLRSTELREAALLLKPDNDEQRIKLIREYARHNLSYNMVGSWPGGEKSDDSNPLWVAAFERAVSDWKRSLQHCEHLVINRRLSREEATGLAHETLQSLNAVMNGNLHRLGDCKKFKMDFLRFVFSRIAHLDAAPPKVLDNLTGMRDVYHSIFRNMDFDRDALELVSDLLINRLPESMWPSYELIFTLQHASSALTYEQGKNAYFTEQEYLEFLDCLMASKRPLVRVYGRYGKLHLRRAKGERSPAMLEEAKGIVTDAKTVGFDLREYDYFMNRLEDEVWELDNALKQKNTQTIQSSPQPPPSQPQIPKSRISLEPIDLRLSNTKDSGELLSPDMKWFSLNGWAGIHWYRPLTNDLDAIWSCGAVFFMPHQGEVVQVLANEKLSVADVVWDGRNVWVAAFKDWGLSVLDRDGKELARIGQKDGLPPCSFSGLVIHPIEPGRVLVSGSFGKEIRGWIAIVNFDGGTSKVEVIHEGTEVWDRNNRDDSQSLNPKKTFAPGAVVEHLIPGERPRRIFFIERSKGPPLMIDAESLHVQVYPGNSENKKWFPRGGSPSNSFLSDQGILWVAGSKDDFCSYRFNEETSLFDVVRDRPDYHIGNASEGSLCRDGDWLHYVGHKWRRLNLKTGAEELLMDDYRALPHYGSGGDWRLYHSAHYGLVAFHEGHLYRVKINPKQSSKKETNKNSLRFTTYAFMISPLCLLFIANLYRRRKRNMQLGSGA